MPKRPRRKNIGQNNSRIRPPIGGPPRGTYAIRKMLLNNGKNNCRPREFIVDVRQVGQYKPQLVGFNSASADLKAFIQRSIVLGIQAKGFCTRPNKPWEGDDYFDSRNSEASIDIKNVVGGWGKATPSLNEIATLSGIAGKIDVDGEKVAFLWLDGRLDEIVAYNEFDALTTYLVWLRVAHFGGHFTDQEYEVEQQLVRELILSEMENGKMHLKKYLEEWDRLKARI